MGKAGVPIPLSPLKSDARFLPSSGKSRNVIPKPDHKNPLAVFFQHGAESLDLSPFPAPSIPEKLTKLVRLFFRNTSSRHSEVSELAWLDFSLGDWAAMGKCDDSSDSHGGAYQILTLIQWNVPAVVLPVQSLLQPAGGAHGGLLKRSRAEPTASGRCFAAVQKRTEMWRLCP